MSRTLLAGVLLAATVVAAALSPVPAVAATTGASAPQTGRIVDDDPAGFTPNVMDGEVLTLARVGDLVYVGGSFTTVRNAGSSTNLARTNLFAFNARTGVVSTSFVPNPNGTVYKVLPAADGTSLYVGGNFSRVTSNGAATAVSRLTRLDATTGVKDDGFSPGSFNGQVRDLELTGNRLWVAGKFTHVQGRAQLALGTLNATTGAYDPFFTGKLAGLHRPELAGSVTDVLAISTDPANNQLMAVGNFTSVDGQTRSQIVKFNIGGSSYSLANWYTRLFESGCSTKFDTYMTDVSYSPDGSFAIVSTTGAWGGSASNTTSSGCDVVARFESDGTGTSIRPTWGAYTGGDTTWSVEVTDDVVYVGGHQRWQNNPTAGDAAGQGAVARTGIAALNPVNGMPYSWNPTRDRGIGVKDMLATEEGLFVGSDTNVFAGESHYKVAFLPLASGKALPEDRALTLPADLYTVPAGGSQLTRRRFDGSTATDPVAAPNGPGWGTSVGAFMLRGTLYTAYSNGSFTKQTFDGSTYGPVSSVNTADLLVRQTDWHNVDVPAITSLFYDRGRIYFTRSGQNVLYSRGFEPESDVVGQLRYTSSAVTGISYSAFRGAFVAGDTLYWANSSGQLSSARWAGTAPVAGTAQVLSGAGTGWASRAMFLFQGSSPDGPGNLPPTASFTASCDQLTCSFDGRASSDGDGQIAAYRWDFGDGDTATGSTATHSYATAGSRTVTLTVTDDGGASAQATRTVSPSDATVPTAFVAAAATTGNRTNHTVTIPTSVQAGDQLLLFFTGNTTSASYTAPSGWTLQQSRSGDNTVGYAYARTATAADAGRTVAVTSDVYVKDVVTVAAYRGGSVTASASALETATSATHTTPSVTAPDDRQHLVSYWSDKSSATTSWTLPSGVTRRAGAAGSPTGHISAVLGDSDGPVDAGSRGSLTATADASGSAAVTFSVLIG